MRFSLSNWSLEDFAHQWVHPCVEAGSANSLRHARYIGSHMLAGGLSLAFAPVFAALNAGLVSMPVAVLFVSLGALLLLALFVARTGRLDWAEKGSLALLATAAGMACLASGGLGSALLVSFCALPVIASLFGQRFSLSFSVCAVFAGIGGIGFAAHSGDAIAAVDLSYPAGVISTAIAIATLLGWMTRQQRALGKELLVERERYRLLADNATDLITRHDSNGTTLFASDAARALFGLPADGLLEAGMVEKIHLQDRIVFLKAISDAAHTNTEQVCELRVLCKGRDSTIWKQIEMQARPVRDPESGIIDVVSTSRDITKVKREEIDARKAAEIVEDVQAAQKRFLAIMSHELRTPLNAIIGFSQILHHEPITNLSQEKRREYAGLIEQSGELLLSVVNDMLDMSRIEAGKYEINVAEFPLHEVAESTLQMLQPMAQKSNIAVKCDVPESLPAINGDRRACQQILINLASNAIKFTPERGEVRIVAKQHGPSVKLRVKDTGVGIDAEFLPSIGQPFAQFNTGHDREYGGSGLGLSVVRGLVELHGGEFEITSTKGEGTTVTITLPVKPRVSRPLPADELAQLVQLKRPVGNSKITKLSHDEKQSEGVSCARVSA